MSDAAYLFAGKNVVTTSFIVVISKRWYIPLILITVILQGCSSGRGFMPTPNLFLEESSYSIKNDSQTQVSPDLKMLFVTDRLNTADEGASPRFGSLRSSSATFGETAISLRPSQDWESLRDASDGHRNRSHNQIFYGSSTTTNHGSFPATPYLFSVNDGQSVIDSDVQYELENANAKFRQLILDRMKEYDSNEVVLYVHGFNNSFDFAAQTLGGIWHFLQRKHVPILYSWPAGATGIRGYFVDTVSGDFTIFHLKETLRLLIDTPEIEKIHLIAHSRGTSVVTTAMRELIIEDRKNNRNTKDAFRIENLILAAPDLDYGVIRQRLMAEAFGAAFGQVNVYTTATDKALTVAQFLQRGIRFGLLASSDLNAQDRSILERVGNVHFIQAQDIRSLTGHDYFVANSAVSSDLLTVINHSATPGSELRPLTNEQGNFWLLPSTYYRE